jgi:signal transduction histidine kinase
MCECLHSDDAQGDGMMAYDVAGMASGLPSEEAPALPLFAAASHDLRQPLQAIGLLLDRLALRPLDLEARAIVSNLDRLVGGMGELLETLHDAIRTESGAMKPQLSVVPLADVLGSLAVTFAPLAVAKRLDLRIVASSATVHTDRRMLERILSNLASNAIKYTKDGGHILIACRQRLDHLRIEIRDNGIGIPANDLDVMSERFQRWTPGHGRAGGLGLGLHIVRSFADALGAQVQIRSQSGKGTTVAVLIPTPDASPAPLERTS